MLEVTQNCNRRNIIPVFLFVCKALHCVTENNDQVELTLLEEMKFAMRQEQGAECSGHAVVRTTKMNTSETSYRAHVSAPWQDLSHRDRHYFDKVRTDGNSHLQEYRIQQSQKKLRHTFEDELSMPSFPDIPPVSETESEKMRSRGGSHPCLTGRVWGCGGDDRQGLCAPPKTQGGCVQRRKLKQPLVTTAVRIPSGLTDLHLAVNERDLSDATKAAWICGPFPIKRQGR